MLSQLRQIFKFAMGKRLLEKDPSTGIEAKTSPRRVLLGPNAKSTEPVHMFDLATSSRIAKGLHVRHQMAFWIMRCVGTRISRPLVSRSVTFTTSKVK